MLKVDNLYWLGILFGISSYLVTKDVDGHLKLFFALFAVIAFIYSILMPICFKQQTTIHSFGHIVIFEIFSIIPFFINPELEEMAGMLYIMILFSTGFIVLLGAFVLFIFRKEKGYT